jgi:hypothetical protein
MHLGRRDRYGRLGLALACLVLGSPPASACGWWGCDDGRYGYRQPFLAYGYGPTRAYRYAYSSPRWRRAYRVSGPPLPDAGSTGLTAPVATAEGLLEAGLPGRGPTLFGPPAPPPGYYYGQGYYYANGYFQPSNDYSRPPPPTAWVERRR